MTTLRRLAAVAWAGNALISVSAQLTPSTIQFASPAFSVPEDGVSARMVVVRTGDTQAAATVGYATSDGTASAGTKYVAQAGTLRFGAGEASQAIPIAILDNGVVDGDGTVNLTLTHPSGAALGPQTTAILTILDNELTSPWLDFGFAPDLGNNPVDTIALQPDGKILVAGNSNYQVLSGSRSVSTGTILRLNHDGSRDSSFDATLDQRGPVGYSRLRVLLPRLDGGVLIGGSFTNVAGAAHGGLVLLRPDGSIDPSFTTGVGMVGSLNGGLNIDVTVLTGQADGKILVGGSFNRVNGLARSGLARLNADGSLDTNFNARIDVEPNTIVQTVDDRVLVTGGFGTVNGERMPNIARLNGDGTLDTSFHSRFTTGGSIICLAVQSDGKIVIGGSFSQDGSAFRPLARLWSDGTVDTNFLGAAVRGPAGNSGVVYAIAQQADGKMWISGAFTQLGGQARTNFVRLDPNGTVDPSFTLTPDTYPQSMLLQPDGDLVLEGAFSDVEGFAVDRLARVHADPNRVHTIEFSATRYTASWGAGQAQIRVHRLGDTTEPVQVSYATQDGTAMAGVDYLAQSGALAFGPLEVEKTFSVPMLATGLQGGGKSVALALSHPSTNAVLGQVQTAVLTIEDDLPAPHFAPESLVADEAAGQAAVEIVRSGDLNQTLNLAYSTRDGNAVAGKDYQAQSGQITFAPGQATQTIFIPVLDDGVVDGSKTVQITLSNEQVFPNPATALLTIQDHELPVSLDPSFHAPDVSGAIQAAVLQADGKVVVAGGFTRTGDVARNGLARLNQDGTPDLSFDPGTGLANPQSDPSASSLAIDTSGRILVAGDFTHINGIPRLRLARLEANGAVDVSFNSGIQVTGSSPRIVLQPDNRIIVGGSSVPLAINGVQANDIVRLNSDGSPDPSFSTVVRSGYVPSMALQADGKLLVGDSAGQSDVQTPSLVRFNSDGAPDGTFRFVPQHGAATNRDVQAIALQSDGKILVLGDFDLPSPDGSNGTEQRLGLARYLPDGSIDLTFRLKLGLAFQSGPIAILSDGRILLSDGSLLNSDGSLNRPLGLSTSFLLVQPDDRIIASGPAGLGRFFSDLNEPGGPQFAAANASVPPGATQVALQVQRLGDIRSASSVEYQTVDGTARAGEDYLAQTGAIQFGPLQLSQTIVIPLLENPNSVTPRSFQVRLQHPSLGSVLQVQDTATVTLPSDAAGVHFATDTVQVNENDGVAEIVVTRTGTNLGAAVLDFSTSDQSARAGIDYLAREEEVAFAAGELTKTVQVPILDNGTVQGDRSLGLALSNPRVGAILGTPTQATLIIVDNERPTLVDPSFDPGKGGVAYAGGPSNPFSISLQPDGRILVGGNFSFFGGFKSVGVARLNSDGSVDTTFRSALAGFAAFDRIAAQPDGEVLCVYSPPGGGGYGKAISRLLSNGAKDRAFSEPLFLSRSNTADSVRACTVQPDGKILVGGRFDTVNGIGRTNLARLNSDGTLDSAFQVQVGPGDSNYADPLGSVWNILLEPDGRILIGGSFLSVNQSITDGWARLLPDGTLDSGFSVPDFTWPGASAGLDILAVQPDGKLLVQQNGIHRLEPDGTVDPTFSQPNAGVRALVDPRRLIVLPDGKLEFFGYLNEKGLSHSGLIRLNSDGSLDPAVPGLDIRDSANHQLVPVATAIQPDGKVLVMGDFTAVNDVPRDGIARLFGDLFGPPAVMLAAAQTTATEASGLAAVTVRRSGDTSLPATFNYTTVDGTALANSQYLSTSGTLSFDPLESEKTLLIPILDGEVPSSDSSFSVLLSNSSAGALPFGGLTNTLVTLLNSERPGTLDASFNPIIESPSRLRMALQPDGKIVVAGDFQSINGVPQNSIARLLPDGSLDGTFDPQGGLIWRDDQGGLNPAFINSLILEPDGKIIVHGSFNLVSGHSLTNLARLNVDGSLDSRFTPDPIAQQPLGYASALAVQPDGKILLAESVIGPNAVNLGRLTSAGSTDPSFVTLQVTEVLGWSSVFDVMVVETDGRPVFEGHLGSDSAVANGDPKGMTRLNLDGTVDQTFSPMLDSYDLTAALVQPDGKIVIAGNFSRVNGIYRPGLARLNPDGSTDLNFAPTLTGLTGYGVYAMALQPDGKLLVGFPDGSILRFDTQGSRDPSFYLSGEGVVQGGIWDLAVQPDGQILVAGSFTSVSGIARTGLARINGDRYLSHAQAQFRSIGRDGTGDIELRLGVIPGRPLNVESSTNLIDWHAILSETPDDYLLKITDPHGAEPMRFYRAVQGHP